MSRSRMAVVAGAVLAAGLVVSGCGADGGGGGGKDGSGAESAAAQGVLLNQVPMAKVSALTGARGMWTTKKNFVKADLKKIVGYPPAGGKARWTVPLSGEICWSSSRPTEDGLIAVVFKNDKDDPAVCTEIGLVDLNKGAMRWHKQALEDGSAQMFDEVTIGGGTVAAAGTSGSAAWTVGGKPLWKSDPGKKCQDVGYAGGDDKLIAVRDCGGDPEHPKLDVQTVDPRTRAVKSSHSLPAGTENAHVMSVDPLVVGIDSGKAQGGMSVSEFLSIDDSAARGKLLGTIATSGGKYGKYEIDCPATEVEGCGQFAVSKKAGALYLGTQDPLDAGSEAKNDVVAFSLKTGKRIGKVAGAEEGRLLPIGLDEGGRVIAYQEADSISEDAGAVWRIDPASYKKTKALQNPAAHAEIEGRFTSERELGYADGRLYVGTGAVSAPDKVYKEKQPLAMVFGPKK
ncbi:hypothetical protein [Streptomyces sp. NPDC101150]|uniref:hypothetical protein n=1 Tax=Streptomyces sp. NPDC101150 TaxID=3366114 RepID=UPI003804C8B1